MTLGKSDRKNKSEYKIFEGNLQDNDAVRVGYIDKKRGYISGLSVFEANKYAEKNPGTTFIFKNRRKIRYLNINQVNKLTNRNTLPKNGNFELFKEDGSFNACDTVEGLNPDIDYDDNDDLAKDCKTEVVIEGGGGVGAFGSPIIGEDGSLMHVRIVHGGFGYKLPPQVRVFDTCNIGGGVRAFSVLGNTGEIEETYDDIEDVEEYNFNNRRPLSLDLTDNLWGKTYSLTDQIVLGDWDPTQILSLERDTGFVQELNRYLDFLKSFNPNKPWWTTRDTNPVRVVGSKSNTLYPVEHWAWGGSKIEDDLFVAVEFEAFGQGSHKNRNVYFQFTSRDGSHSFRVKGVTGEKRSGKTRRDVHQVLANTTYDVEIRTRQGRSAREKFKRLDEVVLEQGLLEDGGRNAKESKKFQTSGQRSRIIFADVVGSANDNDDIQVMSNIGNFKAHDRRTIELAEEASGRVEDRVANLTSIVLDAEAKIKNLEAKGPLTKSQVEILEEHRGDKTFHEQKIEEITLKKRNRKTYDLTFRVNRRKDKTFTTELDKTFMNRYAVGPQQASNLPGTDKGGKLYTMVWKQNFPHPGEYKFRGLCDHRGTVYFDGEFLMELPGMRGLRKNREKPSKFVSYDVKRSGPHQIKIELQNEVVKTVEQRTLTSVKTKKNNTNDVEFVVLAQGSRRHRRIKFVFTNKDDPNDTFTVENLKKGVDKDTVTHKVVANTTYTVQAVATAKIKDEPVDGQKISIFYKGLNDRNLSNDNAIKPSRISKNNKTIVLVDNKGNDTNATFKIVSTDPGINAKFSDDGKDLVTKFTDKKRGKITLRLDWNDEKEDGRSVRKITVLNKVFKLSGDTGNVEHTIDVERDGVDSFESLVEQGIIEQGKKKKEGGRGSSNTIFADYLGSANDNDDMQIKVENGGVFTTRRKRVRKGSNVRRSTFDLEFVYEETERLRGLKQKILSKGLSTEEVLIERERVFNTKEFIDKADRPLYRTNPNLRGKQGDFFNENAITPFNPLEVDPNYPEIKKRDKNPSAASPIVKPQVKFIERDGVPKLKITGTGKVKIGFGLKVDDNLVTSGVFARQIDIQTDDGLLQLKRDISESVSRRGNTTVTRLVGREREEIYGSGVFTAGQEYDIKMIQSSSGSGFKATDETIIFDDNSDNGIDKNGLLRVEFINRLDSRPKPSEIPEIPIADSNDYAGTHDIVWNNIKFPVTGNYVVEVEVDDEVEIEIGNKKKGRGYVKINKDGFTKSGRSTGKTVYTREIEEGTYDIRAALVQKPGKSINNGNPMGLAMSIKVVYAQIDDEVVVKKSWNENPFGVALTINAPLPPVPTEPIPPHEGPCPPSPFWHTRHENLNSEDDWFPVNHRNDNGSKTWTGFMNRYAVSPILPLGTRGSAKSGTEFTTRWRIDAPYRGFYTLKGAADDRALVTFTQGDAIKGPFKLNGFKTEKADLKPYKVELDEGEAIIEINLKQSEDKRQREVRTKVFDTQDWVAKPTDKSLDRVPVDFDVFGQGTKGNREIKFLFDEIGGSHQFIIDNVKKNNTTETVEKKVKVGVNYKVTALVTGKTSPTKYIKTEIPITYNIDNPKEFGYRIESNGQKIEFDDDAVRFTNLGRSSNTREVKDFDVNATLKIESKSPGVTAKFSDDSKNLIINGPDGGDVTIKFEWNDNPTTSGKVFKSIEISGETFKQTGERGNVTKTIKIGSASNPTGLDEKILEQGVLQRGFGNARGVEESGQSKTSNIVFADYVQSFNDDNDMQIRCTEGIFTPSNKRKVFKDKGRGTWDLTYRLDKNLQTVRQIDSVDGATYNSKKNKIDDDGNIIQPRLATYKRGKLGRRLSPFFKEGRDASEEIQGKTWEMTWDNVDFPITGNYLIKAEADDILFIDIDNKRLGTVRGGSIKRLSADVAQGKRKVKLTLRNRRVSGSTFRENPTYASVRITCLVPDQIQDDRSWRLNPTGVSAVLIPPPCKRNVGGIGTIAQIIVPEPGNGFTTTFVPPPGIGTPTTVPLGTPPPPIRPPGTPPPPGIPVTPITTPPITGIGTDDFIITTTGGTSTGPPPVDDDIDIDDPPLIIPTQLIGKGIHIGEPGIGYTSGDPLIIRGQGGDSNLPPIRLPIIVGPFGRVIDIVFPELPIPEEITIGSGSGTPPPENPTIIPDIGLQTTRKPTIIPPYTSTPIVDIDSPTGAGFKGVLIYDLIVDPIDPEPGTIIQITDLAGLKKTGYVRGRAYYGEVYYENGIRFAGRYKTAGTPIQVFDTLLESIEGEVTTRPSAIQRSGTDVTNNDPRLNIPGTPENLT